MATDPRYQAVHERTISTGINGACMEKQRKSYYWAPNRVPLVDGSFHTIPVRVPDVTSRECRNFYLWKSAECAGCEYPKDIEFQKRMEQA